MPRPLPRAILVTLPVALACGPDVGTNVSATADTGTSNATADTDTSASLSASDTSNPDDGLGCEVLQQDCTPGHKCLPPQVTHIAIITDAQPWCAAISREAAGFAETCTIDPEAFQEPGLVFDTCGAGLICWDAEDIEGRCERLCTAGDAGPSCPDGWFCPQGAALNGVVCVPICDPLAQDCAYPNDTCNLMDGQWGCYPKDASAPGGQGQSCGSQNDCPAGLACVSDDEYPGCDNSFAACCAALCDRNADDPDTVCLATHPTLSCRAWSKAEAAGHGGIGVCVPS